MPNPVGSEFGATAEEISFGQDMRTAAENLYHRVGLKDLVFLVVAINVQTQTGGILRNPGASVPPSAQSYQTATQDSGAERRRSYLGACTFVDAVRSVRRHHADRSELLC